PATVASSKIDPGLKSSDESVGDPARPSGPDDVLKVGLEEKRVPAAAKPTRQLQRDRLPRDACRGIRPPGTTSGVLTVIAAAAIRDAHAPDVGGRRGVEAAEEEAGGAEDRHLTD